MGDRSICELCGTDHEGHEPGTLGALRVCLRSQVEQLGATGLVDQIDAMERDRLASIERRLEDRS